MTTTKPNWLKPEDLNYWIHSLDAGDRIVAIVKWCERDGIASPHIITLTIGEEWPPQDNEHVGYTIHDCLHWMLETEFIKLFAPEIT